MNDNLQHTLWERIREGQHVAVVGHLPGSRLKSRVEFLVIHVNCDGPWTTWGPLEEARTRVEGFVNGESLLSQARDRVFTGLRRRLLGDNSQASTDAELVAACNELHEQTGGRALLVLDHVHAADTATLEALRSLVGRRGWLRMPMVLIFRQEPTSLAKEVLECCGESWGQEALLYVEPEPEHSPEPKPEAEAERVEATEAAESSPALPSLDPDVLRVMRAASMLGEVFDVALLSRLLREDPSAILYALQRAYDAGLPLEDRGEGRFAMPLAVCDVLAASVLPSLQTFWHEQLATLLSPVPDPSLSTDRLPSLDMFSPDPVAKHLDAAGGQESGLEDEAPTFAELFESDADDASSDSLTPDLTSGDDEDAARTEDTLASFAAEAEPPPSSDASVEPDDEPSAEPDLASIPEPIDRESRGFRRARAPRDPSLRDAPAWRSTTRRSPYNRSSRPMDSYPEDTARAAVHLEAAGQREAAIARYIDAAEQVAQRGDARRAYLLVRQALGLLDQLPASPSLARLRGRALLEQGKLQWRGAVLGPPFTLQDALVSFEEAQALLDDTIAPDERAEFSKLIAGVCYDIGDEPALQRALVELTSASRDLMELGQPTEAARLLNDQAAVYVRFGDPVRAVHLLNQSRGLFTEVLRDNPELPVAIAELAETEHLLARLPLHAPARSGRQDDAWSMGLDYAHAAAERYAHLGMSLELGRVHETIGRLQLERGKLDAAAESLSTAIATLQAVGDVTGLAKTSATMSELLIASGRIREALSLLSDSISLNLEKGSPIGLRFNREVLGRIAESPEGQDPWVQQAVRQLEARVATPRS